jgi:hypothetical protein
MDLLRKRNRWEIDLSEDDAKGLFAVWSGQTTSVTPDQLARGQYIYSWLFRDLETLALNYQREVPPQDITIVQKLAKSKKVIVK